MSTAFRESVVLWREPVAAMLRRITGRALVTVVLLALSGVPGFVQGLIPWQWLAVVVWLCAVVAMMQLVVALLNWGRKKRVILVLQPSGSIEWPQSYQEIWLRRPLDYVSGRVVRVTQVQARQPFMLASPRVTLTDGERLLRDVPLFGVTLPTFLETVNALTEPHGVRVTYAERVEEAAQATPDEAPGDESQ